MAKISMERIEAYYRTHRRDNFAASQRLEGIVTAVTAHGVKAPLPTKEELRKKYAARRA